MYCGGLYGTHTSTIATYLVFLNLQLFDFFA